MKKTLKEKDIVEQIINNWDTYFEGTKFCKTEFSLRDFRVDILASFPANLKDLGVRDEDYFTNPSIFFEVKWKSEMRDLLFELKKQIKFRDWYIEYGKAFCMICVISDEFDSHMVEFMVENNITMFKINIENEDIETLSISEYDPFSYDYIKDKLLLKGKDD